MLNATLNEKRQDKAIWNIKYASEQFIGELINALYDYDENSSGYISTKELLNNHDALVREVYHLATNNIYGEGGFSQSGAYASSFIRDIRFCGSEWLMSICDIAVTECGY